MTELKTLKDLKGRFPNWSINVISAIQLKQEAIKWVKHIIKSKNLGSLYIIRDAEDIKWIKHFFNITSEDLKDE